MRAHLAKMSLLFDEADTSGDGRLDLEDGGKKKRLFFWDGWTIIRFFFEKQWASS